MTSRTFVRTSAVACALVAAPSIVLADPPGGGVQAPPVFCFRITDIEKLPGDISGSVYCIEFECLNWSDTPASGVAIVPNVGGFAVFPPFVPGPGTGAPPTIFRADIDPDGRGGAPGGSDIGPGVFDVPAIHSGRGRGDIPGHLNDWIVGPPILGPGVAVWTTGPGGTPIPNRDIIGTIGTGTPPEVAAAWALVPGFGLDTIGDTAVDGGPAPYGPDGTPFPGGGPPVPDGSGNVLDGFVIYVCDWHKGETLSFNWFLLDGTGAPIGTAGFGNTYGFGTVNITLGSTTLGPPGPLFAGNSGFGTSSVDIFDGVGRLPEMPGCEFFVEFGAGITAPTANPNGEQIGQPNTNPIFEQYHSCAVQCPGDATGDLQIDFSDLNFLLSRFGTNCPPPGFPGSTN